MNLVDREYFAFDTAWGAYKVAKEMHEGQVRKYTGEPYIVHPVAVADNVWESFFKSPDYDYWSGGRYTIVDAIAAALLHDTVEDTDYTFDDVVMDFGPVVYELVFYLTDVSNKEEGNRAFRKEKDAQHYASGPGASQTIKVADLIDNTKSIAEFDADFWRVYRKEKGRMLDLFTDADPYLVQIARKQVDTDYPG